MKLNAENINILWGELIVEELRRNGCDFFCISPGSRSTPLTAAVARNKNVKSQIFIDERNAAFFALGYGRATGKPAILICTSGTALANYFPAVVEAKNAHVPMIILSADRPVELRDTGANQTIIQQQIFGNYSKWFFDFSTPTIEADPNFVLSTINQAVAQSCSAPWGPVHLNIAFREPLEPKTVRIPEAYVKKTDRWLQQTSPATVYHIAEKNGISEQTNTVVEEILSSQNSIITIGALKNAAEREAAAEFLKYTTIPVYADILSGIRSPMQHLYFDLNLLSEKFNENMPIEHVLHIGGQITSKRWLTWLENNRPQKYIRISDHVERKDPTHTATDVIETNITDFCQNMVYRFRVQFNPFAGQGNPQNDVVEEILKNEVDKKSELNEPGIARAIAKLLPEQHALFLASSMPVRDFNMYAGRWKGFRNVGANRGASGIDGTLASAIGYATALNKPLTLCIGDLAMLHDLNSLLLLKTSKLPITIVLINNDGGGIFSFLPISGHSEIFEPYFTTPHGLTFENVCQMFELPHFNPKNMAEFKDVFTNAVSGKYHSLIELKLSREKNKTFQSELQQKIQQTLDK